VVADAAADGRERITLSDGVDSFTVFTNGNMSHVFGDVNAYRTGMLAW
jgi:hypothetical protein